MYLACVEVTASPVNRVLELEFNELQAAKIWAVEESSRRNDATGNAAVFETHGPLMSLIWERESIRRPMPVVDDDEVTVALGSPAARLLEA